jgi:hypothetical protein
LAHRDENNCDQPHAASRVLRCMNLHLADSVAKVFLPVGTQILKAVGTTCEK